MVKLDRLGRNALDVLTLIDVLKKREISVRILNLGIDTAGAGGKLFLLLLAGFAEFERNIIRERVLSGLETGRAKDIRLGRKPTLTEEDIAQPRRLKARGLCARKVTKFLHVIQDDGLASHELLKSVPQSLSQNCSTGLIAMQNHPISKSGVFGTEIY